MRIGATSLLLCAAAACSAVSQPPSAVTVPSPSATPTTEAPSDFADASGCRATAPLTSEHPKDANTAAFSTAWYASPDRLLWASAGYRLYAGENKVLWERPGRSIALSGRLWGDVTGRLTPTITPGRGYESTSYQASGVTFPAPGCWEVVARAERSELRFVVLVYPETYAGVARRCQDLSDIFANSDTVTLATSAEERPDESFRGFTWYTLFVVQSWKGSLSVGGRIELLSDAEDEPRITPATRYVLFLGRDAGKPWRIICPFRSVMADTADRTLVRPTDHQRGAALITDGDLATLDARLRALAAR